MLLNSNRLLSQSLKLFTLGNNLPPKNSPKPTTIISSPNNIQIRNKLQFTYFTSIDKPIQSTTLNSII